MNKKSTAHGVSKTEWLEAGLDLLARGNVKAITMEGLARHLEISKSGLYWHFKSRDNLLKGILQHWLGKMSMLMRADEELLSLEPRERLCKVTEEFHNDRLAKCEIAIRQWALHDKAACRVARQVNLLRMEYFDQALAELGITGDEAKIRANLYVNSVFWEPHMVSQVSRKKWRDLISLRISFLTGKTN